MKNQKWKCHLVMVSVLRIFLKKCCIVLYEMLHSFGYPSVTKDQTTCNNERQILYDVL